MNRKTKETGEVDSDGEPVKLEDVEKEGDGGVGDEGDVSLREVKVKEEKPKAKPRAKRGKKAEGEDKENGGEGVKENGAKVKVEEAEPVKPKRARNVKAE